MTLSKGFIFTFSAAFFWAVSIIVAKIVLSGGENVFNLIFWTTLLSSPYWLYVLLRNKNELKSIKKNEVKILLGMGLVSTIGLGIVEFFALKYSPAINYSFLIRSTILFTIFFAYLFLNEKLTHKKIILSIMILIGSYFLTTNGQIISLSMGDVFTLIEAALIAFGNNVLGKMATNKMSVGLSASASILIGAIPIGIIALLSQAVVIPKIPMLILLLTIVYIVMANLRFRAYKNATASYVTMIFSFTPVIVSFIAMPLLGETLSLIQIFGGVLIILAGIFVEKLKI